MIESFLKYLSYEKRYSPKTIIAYQNDLAQLDDYLQLTFEIMSPVEAAHIHLRSWIIHLMEEGIGPRSVNRKLAAIRTFYKFLIKRKQLENDPTKKLTALKTDKKLPHFVREEQINDLFNKIQFENSFEGSRDHLILELLYGTGIRLAELIGLKEQDINFHQEQIKVLGKRNKERIIPFNAQVRSALESFLFHKNQLNLNNVNPYLIVNKTGEQVYPMLIYRTVKKYLTMLSTLEKRSPHVLRHTFATHLLNKGADLNAVKDLLGHSSLAATQVYTHNSLDKLKSVFDQAHPKA